MSEEKEIVLNRNEFRIDSLCNVHSVFANNCNRIVEVVNKEWGHLSYDFDPEFLLKMLNGQVNNEELIFGFGKYIHMIHETDLKSRFAGETKGLTMDMAKALQLWPIPKPSRELADLFAKITHGLSSSVKLENIILKDGKFQLCTKAKAKIEEEHSTILKGQEVEVYEAYQAIAEQLNELSKIYWDGDGPKIDRLIDWAESGKDYAAQRTCVPSVLTMQNSARVAKDSMAGAPEPEGTNGEVAEMFLFDPGAPKPGLKHFTKK